MPEIDSTEPRKKGRRWVRYALVLGALLSIPPILFVAFLPFLLESQAVRKQVLDQVSRLILEKTGLFVSAQDFGLSWRKRSLILREIRVSKENGPPLVTIREAAAVIDIEELRREKIHITSLDLEGVVVDPSAPLPELKGETSDQSAGKPEIRIESFNLRSGQLKPWKLPKEAAAWASRVAASGIHLQGSYDGTAADLTLRVRGVLLERPAGKTLTGWVETKARVENAGAFSVESFDLRTPGLSISANGSGDWRKRKAGDTHVRVLAEPARVLPELCVDGSYEASGTWDAPKGVADFHLEAREVSGESLERFSQKPLLDLLNASGTRFSASAEGRFWPGTTPRVSGQAKLFWNHGAEPLMHVAAELPESQTGSLSPSFQLSLLPRLEGRRFLDVRLEVPGWTAMGNARVVHGYLELESPALLKTLVEVRKHWPGLLPLEAMDSRLAGTLNASARFEGPVTALRTKTAGQFQGAGGGTAEWDVTGVFAEKKFDGSVNLIQVPLSYAGPGYEGFVTGTTAFRYAAGKPWVSVNAEGRDLCLGTSGATLEHVSLAAHGTQEHAVVESLELSAGGVSTRITGNAAPLAPWNRAHISLETTSFPNLGPATITADARSGVVDLVLAPLDTPAGLIGAQATLPLGALRHVPLLAEQMARLPRNLPGGPVLVDFAVASLDSCGVTRLGESVFTAFSQPVPPAVLEFEKTADRLQTSFGLSIAANLENPESSTAQLNTSEIHLDFANVSLDTAFPVEAALQNGRISVEPFHLLGKSTEFGLYGWAQLDKRLFHGKPVNDPVQSVFFSAAGFFDASLLKPFLAGGIPSGLIEADSEFSGPVDSLTGQVKLRGKDFAIVWPRPYLTRIERASLQATFSEGGLEITDGRAQINGGDVLLTGSLIPKKGLDLRSSFSDVRYRLAYGLRSTFNGNIDLYFPWEGRRLLSGNIVLDRGVLDRDIDLDQEILNRMLAPPESRETEPGVLDTIDLNLQVTTTSGVRVRNNLADLRAVWSSITASGTAAEPIIRGRIDVEKGGRVFAYQQVFRIDSGAVIYTGDPASDPRMDFVTTSSLEDPSILNADTIGRFETSPAAADAAEALATGLATYYSERLTRGIGEALGGTRILFRPVLVFGETDPGTKLTVSKDISRNVLFAFTLDLKNTQRQTYLIDLHDFGRLPSLTAQAFTSEDGTYGGTLQQKITFGASKPRDEGLPRLRKVVWDAPKGVITRAVKQNVKLGRGDAVARDYPFDLEVDLSTALRARGYPGAEVTVGMNPVEGKASRVDLHIKVLPGKRTEVVFEGDKPPGPSRSLIAASYFPNEEEASSLDEMTAQTRRVFRSLGYPDPKVEMSAVDRELRGESVRIITITTRAGEKRPIENVVFNGVTESEKQYLSSRFAGPAERLELARKEPGALRRLKSSLDLLGRPMARVVAVVLSAGGKDLTVDVDGGPHSLISGFEMGGVDTPMAQNLLKELPLNPGDIARGDQIALGSIRLEEKLQSLGFAGARVKAVILPVSPELVPPLLVRYEIETGEPAVLNSIQFSGRRFTSRKFLYRTADLTKGQAAVRRETDEARARLFDTGIFTSVQSEFHRKAPGEIDVVFTLEEKPRFSVAYGLRWEDQEGFQAVVDLLDQNFLGRGMAVGVRGLYSRDDRSGRLYFASRGILGTKLDVETFLEIRRRLEAGFVDDTTEFTLQLSHPLSRKLTARLYGRYRKSHQFEETPLDPDFPIDITLSLPYIGTQIIFDSRDDPVFVTRGYLATLDVQGSDTFLSSDFSYLRAFAQVNAFVPVFRMKAGPVVWGQSYRFGLAEPFREQELIGDVRFYAGGDSSVRGYPLDSLGPYSWLFGPLGGSRVALINQELRIPLHPYISGLVFFDAGSVWDAQSTYQDFLAKSAGIGLRGNTPLGILRADFAFPLDRREDDPSWKFYFGFGNAF